jgi:DNA-binding NarL/FixJ family response regulator
MLEAGSSAAGKAKRTRVTVLSPLRFFADALAAELSRHPQIEARGWSVTDPHAHADVLLVDVHSRGLEVLRHARDRFPGVPIVALGVDERPQPVIAAIEAGALGYVRKDAQLDELVAAVERASQGEALCPPTIAGELFRRVAGLAQELALDPIATELLTPREREIAVMVSRGFTNKAIARQLGVRIPTVKSHVHQVLRKLGLTSRLGLLAAARRNPELLGPARAARESA